MNYISPCNHPESYLSGSTVESMIDKTEELGLEYFACTDNGTLTSVLKAILYGKKKGIKVIPGVELFFKDNECEIIQNTPSEAIKYFKIVVHAKDQEAYQEIVRQCSDQNKKRVRVGEEEYPLFNWKDLEQISNFNTTVSTSNVECMVSKHLLVGNGKASEAYYLKLKDLFGAENFYPAIVPFAYDKYYNKMMRVNAGGKVVEIPANDRVITDSKYFKNHAKDLTRRGHTKLKSVFINKVKYNVKEEFQDIQKVESFHGFSDLPSDIQAQANLLIFALAKRHGDMDRLLINNYAYYANKDDKVVQDMKLGEERRMYQANYMAGIEEAQDYIKSKLGLTDNAVSLLVGNSLSFADNFKDFELKYDYRLVDPGPEPEKQLIEIIKKNGRMKWDDPVYLQQFKEEFELLTKNGVINLVPYFLPIVDVYDFYKTNGYLTGPARGSAGGFLISYLMGITHIDPIKYGLSSSRFLTIDRVQSGNLPDIDCDLESRVPLVGKDGNSGYLFDRYGDKAAQISTRTLLRIKSAILDANRFKNGGAVEESIQKFSKSLPPTPQGVSDYDYVLGEGGLLANNEELQKYAVDRPEEWDIVKRALSLARQNSRHACAYVISDEPIENTVPIMEVGGVKRVTQPEAKQCEEAGLIKYDFLVVSCLRDINLCLDYINKKHGDEDIETGYFCDTGDHDLQYIWDLPEDPNVFKMLSRGETESVFQLNTTSVTPFVKKIQPQSIIDCATITSLVRPGPLDFVDERTGLNMVEEYVERKFGRSRGDIPILDEMLPETYGVLVFQEQVTKLAKELAGMSVIDAENVRIAVGKKKMKLIQSLKPVFIEGAAKKVGEETATKIWDMMETFARYGFNKSHAVAYSVISYACAYLKYHYPLEWWAAVLSNADDKEINEVFYKYVKDMVLPPDINTSTEIMEVDYKEKKIRNKLSMISGLGKSLAEKIIAGRPYADLRDFVRKKPCGPAMTKKLIHVGVLDSMFTSTKLVDKMYEFDKVCKEVDWENKIQTKKEQLEVELDEKKIGRLQKSIEKLNADGPKEPEVDSSYIGITAQQDYLMKKSIFPTMNLDLQAVLDKESKTRLTTTKTGRFITNKYAKDNMVISGEALQRIDNKILDKNTYFACPAYVVDASEFTYHQTKKALRLVLDSSGYISEKVLWADYNTGELIYPKSLKKGAIAYFLYSKREGSEYTNIQEIIVENEGVL